MRVPTSVGALVASGLLSQSLAQAPEYGSPNGDHNRSSGAATQGPGSGSPGGSSNSPSCVLQGTTTVFVTVLPTSPSNSGVSQPSVHTVTETLPPTTVFLSAGAPGGTGAPGNSGSPDGSSPSDGSGYPNGSSPSDGSGYPDGFDPSENPGYPDGFDPSDGSGFPDDFDPSDGSGYPNGPGPSDGSAYPSGSGPSDGSGYPSGSGPSDGSENSNGSGAPVISASATLGPDESPLVTSALKPFTTLTIDVWGSGPDSGDNLSQTGVGSAPATRPTRPPKPASESSKSTSGSGAATSQYPDSIPDGPPILTSGGPRVPAYPSDFQASNALPVSVGGQGSVPKSYGTPDSSDQQASGNLPMTASGAAQFPNGGSPRYSVVTDTDVYWTNGPAGPSQVTVLSPQTLTLGGAPAVSPGSHGSGQNGPATKTVFGPDGKPTIVIDSAGSPFGNGQNPSTPSGNGQSPPGSKTVLGPDGKPTCVIDSAGNPSGNGKTPSASMTITGADGIPTIFSGPVGNTGSGPNTPNSMTITGSDGIPTVVIGPAGSPQNGGVHYPPCVKTTTGVNGKPTVVIDSSRNSPGDDQGMPSDMPRPTGPVSSLSGYPFPSSPSDGSASFPQNDPVITSAMYTVTGADGRPTIFESTWAVPKNTPFASAFPAPTFAPMTGWPGVSTPGSLPTNGPFMPSDGTGVTTSFTFTYTGMDGIPTAVESTVVITPTPTDAVSFASAALPNGFSSAPGGVPDGAGITTCFTYLTTGADGLPTLVDQTVVLPPTNAVSDAAGLPTNLPSTPGAGLPGGAPVTTCFYHTFTGVDGHPTVLETTITATPTNAGSGTPNGLPQASNGFPGGYPGPIFTQASFSGLPSGVSGGFPSGFPTASGIQGGPTGAPVFTTFTYIGADGRPTVVESVQTVPTGLSNAQGGPGGVPATASFTYIGADGRPTVFESVYTAPGPMTLGSAHPWGNNLPSTGFPWQMTPPASIPSGGPGGPGGAGVTTCTSFTVLGADGLPTVIDSTYVIPGPLNTQSALPLPQVPGGASNALPSGFPQITGFPSSPSNNGAGETVATTCTSYTLLGPDGLPTVVEATWTVPMIEPVPVATKLGHPSAVTPMSGLPQGMPSPAPGNGAVTTSFTAISIGPNGSPTPVVQTVVFTPGPGAQTAGIPGPSDYGAGSPGLETIFAPFPPNFTPIMTDGRVLPGGGVLPPLISGTWTGTRTATFTVTSNAGGAGLPFPSDILPPTYGDSANAGDAMPKPYDAASPSDMTLWPAASALKTSTWTNVIPEPTTTYTLNYPLTTMATMTSSKQGGKRVVRRQEVPADAPVFWANSSTPTTGPLTPLPTTPAGTPVPTPSSGSVMCAAGGKIGKHTLDFDDIKPGPLYNPAGDFWFSEGFSVAPPSSQVASYVASSGGQLIEFVPPSLSSSLSGGSADTAEFGVGPHFASPCFKFDLYGLNLGCAAEGPEQWCEFEISAYAYNAATGKSESTSWSETKRVPACPNYAAGGCSLTPVELEGYTGITSVLITLRVGLDLRVWWGDDLRVGWTDNSCEAAICRADASNAFAKRDTETSLRRRFWNLVPSGLKTHRGATDGKAEH